MYKTSAGSLLSQIGKLPSRGCLALPYLALLLLRIGNGKETEGYFVAKSYLQQACKPRSYASLKLRSSASLTRVKSRATSVAKNSVSQKWVSNSDNSVWQFGENIWPWLQKYLAAKVSIKLGRHRQCSLQYLQCHERLRDSTQSHE